MSDVSDRLIQARKSAGYATAADAARALGVRLPTYYSHENGSIGLRAHVAEVYARKFKVSLNWLISGRGEMFASGVVPHEQGIAGLPLLGSIQAGHWLETTFADGGEIEMVPVVRDQRFPHAKQYALRVVGTSMDLDYPDGSIVTCVDFAESGLALAEGMTVHVERHRGGGQLVEITLKYVERRKGGGYVLVPHSSDPKYTPIHLNNSNSDTEVFVKGIVTGGWRPAAIPMPR